MADEETGAQQFTVEVQAGREKLLTAFGSRGFSGPLLNVIKPPKNGKYQVRNLRVTGPCHGQGSNPCSDAESNGSGVYYTPDQGFHGTDRLQVDVTWQVPSGGRVVQIITIQVVEG